MRKEIKRILKQALPKTTIGFGDDAVDYYEITMKRGEIADEIEQIVNKEIDRRNMECRQYYESKYAEKDEPADIRFPVESPLDILLNQIFPGNVLQKKVIPICDHKVCAEYKICSQCPAR